MYNGNQNGFNRRSGNKKNNYGNSSQKPEIIPFDPNALNTSNYVDTAEKVIIDHKNKDKKDIITTSQIRNLLELTNRIYEMVRLSQDNTLSEEDTRVLWTGKI